MKIVFVQPAQFFRTERKTNPFFDPIIAVCEKDGIDWELWLQDGAERHGYAARRVRNCRWIRLATLWMYRFFHYVFFLPTWLSYECAGYILGVVTCRRGRADVYVTVAGAFADVIPGMYPGARVVDVQHGVVYSRHSGYFDGSQRLLPYYQFMTHREFWVYGKGYADCFFKNPENAKDLEGRVKIIGDVVRAEKWRSGGVEECGSGGVMSGGGVRNLVVFSLQLTHDTDFEELDASVKRMEKFFDEFFKKFGDRYVCLVKHHPRYDNVYDMSGFFARFPQVKETKEQWAELYPRMALHVTYCSTVTFDCASAGVPTYLLDFPDAKILKRDLFRDDYEYPYFDKSVEELLAMPFAEARKAMVEWYRKFYAPFSAENCLRLLKGE